MSFRTVDDEHLGRRVPRDCHELTCNLLIQLYYLQSTVENIDQLQAAKVRYVVSKAKNYVKEPVHALTSKVPACQYNQVLEMFRPLTITWTGCVKTWP